MRFALLAFLSLLFFGPAAGAGVSVALLPSTVEVDPGAEFDIQFTVTAAADSFNGYDMVVGYDSSKLTIIGRPASEQEGPLMTEACINRFHIFDVAQDSTQVSVAHVLLCAGKRIAGPGVLYELRFRAAEVNAVTQLELLEGTTFYNGGPEVEPVQTSDATVVIGTGTPAPSTPGHGLRLEAAPNPFNPKTTFTFGVDRPGRVRLDMYSLAGRHVVTLVDGWRDVGLHDQTWDGTDAAGRAVASAPYFAQLRVGDRVLRRTVALIK